MKSTVNICLIVFVGALVVSFLVLKKNIRKKRVIHIVDLLVFILTTSSIVVTVYDAGKTREVYKRNFIMLKNGSDSIYSDSIYIEQHLCKDRYNINPIKTDNSPADFDAITEDKRQLYYWIDNNKDTILSMIHDNKKIDIDELGYPKYLKTKYFENDKIKLQRAIERYNIHLDEKLKMQNEILQMNETSEILQKLAMILIIMGIALYLSKWILEHKEISNA